MLYTIPNLPYDIVPEGHSAEDNEVVKTGGNNTELPANPLPHWELAKKYDLIDFDLGVKITGAGFPVYKGLGARLLTRSHQLLLRRSARSRLHRNNASYCC